MTTDNNDKITLPMSERRPLRVSKAAWPRIARATDHDGDQGIESRANRRWWINVRQHADGRTAVYGSRSSNWANEPDADGGFLLTAEEAQDDDTLVRTIRRVAGIIGRDDLAQYCINDLPPEEDDDAPERESRLDRALSAVSALDEAELQALRAIVAPK